jgi:hypothetical protein
MPSPTTTANSNATFNSTIVSRLIIVLLCTATINAAQADPIYRCTNGLGERSYQDFPCAADTKSVQMQVLPAPTLLPQERRAIEQAALEASQGNSRQSTRAARQRGVSQRNASSRRNTARRQQSNNATTTSSQTASKQSRGKRKKLRAIAQVYRAGCPETTEQSGSYVIKGNSLNLPNGAKQKTKRAMYDAALHYKSLPSKTYLKNQGLWPAHCD